MPNNVLQLLQKVESSLDLSMVTKCDLGVYSHCLQLLYGGSGRVITVSFARILQKCHQMHHSIDEAMLGQAGKPSNHHTNQDCNERRTVLPGGHILLQKQPESGLQLRHSQGIAAFLLGPRNLALERLFLCELLVIQVHNCLD